MRGTAYGDVFAMLCLMATVAVVVGFGSSARTGVGENSDEIRLSQERGNEILGGE